MQQTQQKKPTQPPRYGVTYPEGEEKRVSLYSRDSLTRACRGNERMASVLEYFIYAGSWEMENQGLPEGCKVVVFTCTHAQILKKLTFNLSRKSLIGFLDTLNDWTLVLSEKYHNHFTVDFEAIQAAIDNPPAPKERKPRTRKGCKVEAITSEDTTSTSAKKVEELQRKVEELQHYVEELQPLGCKYSTLQRDFVALVAMLQRHFPEDPILLDYTLPSSTDKEKGAFATAHASLAHDLENAVDEEDANPTNFHVPTPASFQAIPSEQTPGPGALPPSAEPPIGATSGITSDQASLPVSVVPEPAQAVPSPTAGSASAPTAQASGGRAKPEKPVQQALSTTTEGHVTQECTQDKPKRGRKDGVQLTLQEAQLKDWYEELRGVSVNLNNKRDRTSLQGLGKKKGAAGGPATKEDLLNVAAILDADKWFEEHKIGVDLYWINFHWDNKIIFLRGRKNPPADKRQTDNLYTSIDAIMAMKQPKRLEGV